MTKVRVQPKELLDWLRAAGLPQLTGFLSLTAHPHNQQKKATHEDIHNSARGRPPCSSLAQTAPSIKAASRTQVCFKKGKVKATDTTAQRAQNSPIQPTEILSSFPLPCLPHTSFLQICKRGKKIIIIKPVLTNKGEEGEEGRRLG